MDASVPAHHHSADRLFPDSSQAPCHGGARHSGGALPGRIFLDFDFFRKKEDPSRAARSALHGCDACRHHHPLCRHQPAGGSAAHPLLLLEPAGNLAELGHLAAQSRQALKPALRHCRTKPNRYLTGRPDTASSIFPIHKQ